MSDQQEQPQQRRRVRHPDSPEAQQARAEGRERDELHRRTVAALEGIRDALD